MKCGSIYCLAFRRHNGKLYLLTGSLDWTARLWALGNANWESIVMVGHSAAVNAVEWADCPGSREPSLLTGCADGSVGFWDMAGGLTNILQAHSAEVKLIRKVSGRNWAHSGSSSKCSHMIRPRLTLVVSDTQHTFRPQLY